MQWIYTTIHILIRNTIFCSIYGKFVKLGTNVNKHTLLQCEVVANGLDELKVFTITIHITLM